MNRRAAAGLAAAGLVCWAALAGGCSAPAAPPPSPGQPGKDVIWLPTPDSLVERMLDLARVTPADLVVDLGSGDGRTVIAAARRGARALGIEFDPALVELSRRSAAGTKATFVQGDIFESDFSEATVVTLFLLSSLNEKLRPRLLDMKPGTRIVSNTFRMGQWQPDAEASTGCGSFCTAYLWIVPAKVDGYWTSGASEIAFTQDFQRVLGTVKSGGASATILDGRLRGAEIEFRVPGADYRGTVKGETIEGTVTTGGASSAWTAVRRRL